jgi:hypothetical protein
MDQRSQRLGASWLIGSGFALVLGLTVDFAARAEDPETQAAATTSKGSDDAASTQASPTEAQAGEQEARAKNAKAKNKAKAKRQPKELLALSSALEEPPEIVCKNLTLTGSNMKRRICGTAEQWDEAKKKKSDAAQEGMRQMRDQTRQVSPAGAFPPSSASQ